MPGGKRQRPIRDGRAQKESAGAATEKRLYKRKFESYLQSVSALFNFHFLPRSSTV